MKNKTGLELLIAGGLILAASTIMVAAAVLALSFAGLSGGDTAKADPCVAHAPFVNVAKAQSLPNPGKPPQKFIPIYQAAASKFKLGPLGPSILAAIHGVESGYHDSGGPPANSAGAEGPMQFLPSTWASQGQDGNGDGKKDIMNVNDAIFGAANYLHNSGAPGDWRKAIFAYNHADWYVNGVLQYAKQFKIPAKGGATC